MAKSPEKQLYTVKVEAIAPIELIYKIWAENPDEAAEKVSKQALNSYLVGTPKIKYSQIRRSKGVVYKFGSIVMEKIIKFMR